MGKARIILHIDINAFFASAEILRHPELKGKPVVICSKSKRGVISTCTYQARDFGIHSGMPLFLAEKKCPRLIVVEPDFDYYIGLSENFFQILRQWCPIVEPASIDEAYLDITDCWTGKSVISYVKSIQEDLYQKTGLMTSIGVAPNRFLAKMGSDMKKPGGISVVRKRQIKEKIWPLDIGQMHGIGKKSAQRLHQAGYNTIGDIACVDYRILYPILGSSSYHFVSLANGNGEDKVLQNLPEAKSIGHSTTLDNDTCDREEILSYLSELTKEVCERAKSYNQVAKKAMITLKYDDFTQTTMQKTLPHKTNSYHHIIDMIKYLFDKLFENRPVRLVGVSLHSLTLGTYEQLDLFTYLDKIKQEQEEKCEK